MRLRDLDGGLYRYPGNNLFVPVKARAKADSVMFLCPLCFEKNKGKRGTHSVRVDFVGGRVPDDVCIKNEEGKPVRWTAVGTTIDDLTLTPSIQILHGCKWHGFVTKGDAA